MPIGLLLLRNFSVQQAFAGQYLASLEIRRVPFFVITGAGIGVSDQGISGAGIGPVGRIVGRCSCPFINNTNEKTIVMAARSFNIFLELARREGQPSQSASRRNDDGKHVHVEFFLKTEPELPQPLVLGQIGWLLSSHRTLVFDP